MSIRPHERAKWYRYTEAASIGIEIAVSIAVGAVGGFYLGEYVTHWNPWTMLLGLLVGIGAATLAVIRTVKTFEEQNRAEAAAEARRREKEGAGAHASAPRAGSAPGSELRHG